VDLYEYALLSSFQITKQEHSEVKVLLRDDVPLPLLGKDEHGYILYFAKPKKMRNGKISYLGLLFDSNEALHRELLWRIFKASTCHLSLHVVVSNFEAYANWSRDKDIDLATYTAKMVEDAVARAYLKAFCSSLILDTVIANVVSYLSMKPSHLILNDTLRVMTAVLSNFWVGLSKGDMSQNTLKDVNEAVSALNRLENVVHKEFIDSAKVKNEAEDETLRHNYGQLLLEERIKTADCLYEMLQSYGETSEVPSLPYTESHGRNSVFYETSVPTLNQIEQVLKNAQSVFNLETVNGETVQNQLMERSIQDEVSQVFADWEARDAAKRKILEQYRLLGKNTHFNSFEFPQEDYAEFLRRRLFLSGTVRRVLEKLRLLRNIGGDDFRQEVGMLDLQEAIQVIASKSPRTDVFVRDELQTMDELWTILIDASHSLSFFAGEVQGIALCMAEVARSLISNPSSWSMFAFSNKFYVVKDFSEPYSNHTRARIGGLKHSGMTYLPDGLLLAGETLRRQTGEMKILLVVSDFFPTGYGEVEKTLVESVKRVEKSGIGVIGMGINSSAVKKYCRTNCVVENPYDLMKQFVKAFYEYSSTV
jgi:hypothetical protein